MKRILITFYLAFNGVMSYAQINKNAIIITKQNDTIRTSIKVDLASSVFRKKDSLIAGSYFDSRIRFSFPTDKKFIKSEEVKYLEFELDSNKVVFVSKDQVPEIKANRNLIQQVAIGKLNWYRSYYYLNYTENTTDYFFLTGQPAFSGSLFTNSKKKLKEITADRPDLAPMIENIKGFWQADQDKATRKFVNAYNENK